MSALDRAITKAYAKQRAGSSGGAAASADLPVAPTVGHAPQVDQLYSEAAYYRVEAPLGTSAMDHAVPAPHLSSATDAHRPAAEPTAKEAGTHPPSLALPPPSSPRRSLRRAVLKWLSQAQSTLASETPAPAGESAASLAAPPVSRKVIIRHVPHASTPPPWMLTRPAAEPAKHAATVDLPTEKAAQEPIAVAPLSTVSPLPSEFSSSAVVWPAAQSPASTLPSVVQLAAAQEHLSPCGGHIPTTASATVVVQTWTPGQSVPAPVKLEPSCVPPQPATAKRGEAAAPASDAIPRPTTALSASPPAPPEAATSAVTSSIPPAQPEPAQSPIPSSSLAPSSAPSAWRLDAAHAQPRWHVRPAASVHDTLPVPPAATQPPGSSAMPSLPATEGEGGDADQVLASDLIPHAPATRPPSTAPPSPPSAAEASPPAALHPDDPPPSAAPARPPVWEVDRFHWPRTCQKLLADEDGSLAEAGEKLVAAVRDGMRVLAITGTRRGEGRSTLALCLARVAAGAGLNVVLMDGDFARPQLASKLGLQVACGWQDAALGTIPLSETAILSREDALTLMPLTSGPATRSLSLADPRVTATLRAAAATFELVVLDLGPIAPGEMLALPPGEPCPLDAAIVVRDTRLTDLAESQAVGRMLQAAGIDAVGIAENFVVAEEVPRPIFD